MIILMVFVLINLELCILDIQLLANLFFLYFDNKSNDARSYLIAVLILYRHFTVYPLLDYEKSQCRGFIATKLILAVFTKLGIETDYYTFTFLGL